MITNHRARGALLLSYACCLSLAASAVTIDSPEVGQFFKLPSWAPAAVDSEHTPGSPETVVDVYSNAVNTGRKAVRPFRLVPERFSSFYATFEAYYERLYYTSCGSRNVWDVSEWGPRNPDHLFRFDMPTNSPDHSSFYEPQTNRTVRTRRLVESDNLVRMYEGIRDMHAWNRPWRPSWSNYHNSAFISTTVFDDMGLSVDWPENSVWGGPGNVLGQLTSEQWERTMLTFEDVRKAPPDPTRTFQLDWTTGGDWFSNARGAWDQVNFGESPFNVSEIYDRMLRPSFTDLEKSVTNTTEEVLAYPWGDRSLVTNDFIATRRLIPDSWGRANQVLACYDRSYYSPPFENMSVTGTYQRAEQSRQYLRTGKEPIVVTLGGNYYADGGSGGPSLYVLATGFAEVPVPTLDDKTGEYTNLTVESVSRQYPVAYSSPTDAGGGVYLDESDYFHPDDLWSFVGVYVLADETLPYMASSDEVECYFGESFFFEGCWDGTAYFFFDIGGLSPGGEPWFGVGRCGFRPYPSAQFGASYTMVKSHENVQIGRLDQSTIGDPVPGDFSRVSGDSQHPGCSLHFLLSSGVGTGKDGSPVFADVPVPSPLSYYEFMHGSYHRDDDQWTSRYRTYTSKYIDASGYRDAIDEAYSRVWTQCSSKVDEALGSLWRNSARMTAIGEDDVTEVFGGLFVTNGMKIAARFSGEGGGYLDLPGSPWPNQTIISLTVRREEVGGVGFAVVTKMTYRDLASGEVIETDDEDVIGGASVRAIKDWYTLDLPAHPLHGASPGAISDGKLWGISRVDWNWNCLRLNKDE